MVDLLDNYKGVYKTIDDASAAIKNGTFGAANPYAPGSANYKNYSNPGAFGTPQQYYPMVQTAAGGLGGTQTTAAQQDAIDAQQRASNGASNSSIGRSIIGGGFMTPAPQMPAPVDNQTTYLNNLVAAGGGNGEWAKSQLGATPAPQMAANSSSDLVRSIIGGTPPMPTPDPNMITNIPKAYGGGTPSYQGTNNVIPVPSPVTANQQLSQFGYPPTPTQFQPTPAPVTAAPAQPAIPVRSDAEIAAYVKQQIDASLGITQSAADQAIAQGQTAAQQQLGSIQSQYDKGQANLKEDRTLQNVSDARTYSPFAGNDQGKISLRDFARERTDREASQGLATSQGNVNQNLTDLQNSINAKQKALVDASPAEAAKLNQSLQNDRNQLQLQLRTADRADLQLQQQAAQDDFMRQSEKFKNNLLGQQQTATLTGKNADGTPTAAQSNSDRTYNAGRQDATTAATGYINPSGMSADQINQQITKNSAAYANADPATRDQLHQQNQYLNGLLGKTDSTGNGDYTGGNPNGAVGYPTMAKQAADTQSKIVQQQLANGQITNETAQFKLDQLKDPNSPVNQAAQLDLQLKQMDVTNAPEEFKLKMQQLQKQIAQIGAAPYRSDTERQLDQVKLDTAKESLKQLQDGGGKPKPGDFNLDDYKGYINSNFYTEKPADPTNPFGAKVKSFDSAGAQKYVDNLNLTASQKSQLAGIYQLKNNSTPSNNDIAQYLK
jgi:hypothetical protein